MHSSDEYPVRSRLIVLQKSKVAAQQILCENMNLEVIADSYGLN